MSFATALEITLIFCIFALSLIGIGSLSYLMYHSTTREEAFFPGVFHLIQARIRSSFEEVAVLFKSFAADDFIVQSTVHDDLSMYSFAQQFPAIATEVKECIMQLWQTNLYSFEQLNRQSVIDTVYRQAIERMERNFVPNVDQLKQHVYFAVLEATKEFSFPQFGYDRNGQLVHASSM